MMFNYYILEHMKTEVDMGSEGTLSGIDESEGPWIFRHPKEANDFLNKVQTRKTFMQVLVVGGRVFHRLLEIDPECKKPIEMEKILLTLPDIVAKEEGADAWPPKEIQSLKFAIDELVSEPVKLWNAR